MADEFGSRWCTECRRRVEIEDQSEESVRERYADEAYSVTHLVCGHSIHHRVPSLDRRHDLYCE